MLHGCICKSMLSPLPPPLFLPQGVKMMPSLGGGDTICANPPHALCCQSGRAPSLRLLTLFCVSSVEVRL